MTTHDTEHPRECPACQTFVFPRWPSGWESHASHACTGLEADDPEARKAEYRRRFREFFENGPEVHLTSRYHEALSFAFQLHWSQRRKGSEVPYVSHLLQVSGLILEAGGDEDQAIAGLLHDALEDAPDGGRTVDWVRDQIRGRFGARVLRMVEACTDTEEQPKPAWRPRKEAYLAALPDKPRDALLVSAADKLHNARAILSDLRAVGPVLWERFTGRRDGTLWYYRSLVDGYRRAFREGGLPSIVAELDAVVTTIESEA